MTGPSTNPPGSLGNGSKNVSFAVKQSGRILTKYARNGLWTLGDKRAFPGEVFSFVFQMLMDAIPIAAPSKFPCHPTPLLRIPVVLPGPLFWAGIFFRLIFVTAHSEPVTHTEWP